MDGDKIRALRKKLDLSQKDLSLELGVSKRTVENWEQGTRFPSEENERKLKELQDGKASVR